MEQMAIATTIATLVGLICNYRQEIGSRRDATHREFMDWLTNHRHNELRDLIAQTHHLQTEIDALLRTDHEHILAEVDRANRVLLDILGRLDEFKGLVQSIRPLSVVSDQAIDILRQVISSGYGGVAIVKHIGGGAIVCFRYGEYGPAIQLTDMLFAEDDIHTLASLGFLRLETSGNGITWFKITRAGADFLHSMEKK